MNSAQSVLQRGSVWPVALRLSLFTGTALVITNLGLPQLITGPLVNALLILAVETGGIKEAIVIGLVTPAGAALRGILPLPLVAMIPFISVGNVLFVGLYGTISKRNRWAALCAGATAKFLFLFGSTALLFLSPLYAEIAGRAKPVGVPDAMLTMMSYPQLITALAGGLIAFGILRMRSSK